MALALKTQPLYLRLLPSLSYLIIVSAVALFSLSIAHKAIAKEQAMPSLVVIIDDIGNNWQHDKQALTLPGPITLAVLPHTPFGPLIADLAEQHNKEVMLHAPMENHSGYYLGEGGLTRHMDELTFKKTLRGDIASIPQAIGINNHTGSALTELEKPMRWTMEVVREHDLFFIDSKTTPKSVALEQAKKHHVVSRTRDVFLDNDLSPSALARQFNQAIHIANKHGAAILIGHPYPASVAFLQKNLPTLDELGIRLVSASALLYLIDKNNNTASNL